MFARAHITIGIAAAYTAVRPETIPEALPVIAGAALGSLICDIDCENSAEKRDSSRWRIITLIIAGLAVIADYSLWKSSEGSLTSGLFGDLCQSSNYLWCVGIAGFVIVCMFASVSKHRGFSHSFVALLMETLSLWLISPLIAIPFAISFATHIALDLTNKKPVRLFYPMKKGQSLGLFYADRFANKVAAFLGTVWLLLIIARQHI